jgi:hypothetical protein
VGDTASRQPSLFDADALAAAMEAGEEAAKACVENAERQGFDSQAAGEWILDHLRRNGETAGEVLVSEAMKVHPAHDSRAYGAVLAGLARRKLIEKCGTVPRVKGHGTAGGIVWRAKAPE